MNRSVALSLVIAAFWITNLKAQTTNSTNEVSSVKDPKKAVGVVITFKNSKGEEIKDATITAATPEELTWKAVKPDGRPFGGRVKFTELPAELAELLGYDPAKVAELNKVRAVAILDQKRDLALRQSGGVIYGKVIQVTDDGLLVELQRSYPLGGKGYFAPFRSGIYLITDVEKAGIVDGQAIRLAAYPKGTYKYTTVSGAESTIRKLTANPYAAVVP